MIFGTKFCWEMPNEEIWKDTEDEVEEHLLILRLLDG